MKPKVLAGVGVAVLVIAGVVVAIVWKRGNENGDKTPATIAVELREKPGDPLSIVDPANGAELFKPNCVSCHGWKGEGDGPAEPFLWRKPRNLSDGSYMNSRTDDRLKLVIANGGKHADVQLSKLMPSWNTTFNTYQQDDLIAWVRRLHPTLEEFGPKGDGVRFESVLSPERAKQAADKAGSALAPGEQFVPFYAVWSTSTPNRPTREDKPAPHPGTAGLGGYVAFTTIEHEGQRIQIGMGVSPDKRVHSVKTFQRVVLLEKDGSRNDRVVDEMVAKFNGAGDNIGTIDARITDRDQLSAELSGAIKRLYWRLLLALEQDKADWEEINAGVKPNESHPGRAIWDKMDCYQCHGPTGRAKGPKVSEKEPQPANFANGAYMSTLSDEYILDLLREGGNALNVSGVMPSYRGRMTDDEMKLLIAYLRTLAK